MHKKCFFLVLLFFSLFSNFISARNLSSDEKKALHYIQNFCFEITRYNMTGLSSLPEAKIFNGISQNVSLIMKRYKYSEDLKKSVYIFEYNFPEKAGIIDCTFSREDLYSVSNPEENYGWIEQTLISFSASETSESQLSGILDGEKILEMLENNDSRGIETGDDGKLTEDIPQEFSYTKNDGSLRRFSYDGEQFALYTGNDESVLINSYGDKLIRKTYDSLYRILKNEQFKLGDTARKMVLTSEIVYEYSENEKYPHKAVEEQFSDKKRIEKIFDKNGKLITCLESHYKTDEKNENEQILLNDKKTSFVYDENGRLKEEENIFWKYKINSFSKTITQERKTKNVYDYSSVTEENSLPPDLKYFEDGSLHLERKYTDSTHYSEKMYFDSGFSVEVLYEDGMRKTEIIYFNEKESRRREFEY